MRLLLAALCFGAPVAAAPKAPPPPVAAKTAGAAARPGAALPSAAAPARAAAGAAAKASVAAAAAASPEAVRAEALAVGRWRDRTAEFLLTHSKVAAGEAGPLPEPAREAAYLIVGGFLSNKTPDALYGNLRRHEKLGLKARLLGFDPQGRGSAARRAIEKAVREAAGPIVIEAHSRGGVLVHDWYRSASPELRAKVAKIVLLQAPLRGTPYADWYLESAWRRFQLGWLARAVFGADLRRAVLELGTRFRARIMSKLAPLSPEDLAKFLVVRTIVSPADDPYHAGRNRIVTARGGPGDGTVPAASAALEGADTVTLDGVNHQQLVLERPGLFKRREGYRPHAHFGVGDAAEAVVRLLFSDADEPAARPAQ